MSVRPSSIASGPGDVPTRFITGAESARGIFLMAKPYWIACRLASYGAFVDAAWAHLPSIGVKHIEVAAPDTPAAAADLREKLTNSGLAVSSFQVRVDIQQADAVEVIRPQLDQCERFGVKIAFVSVKAGDAPRQDVWDRLRAIGDVAAGRDVTMVLETHPDLVTNGEVALATMRAVDHPRIRVNFDTANVSYYNQEVDAVSELAKVIDHVAAVHLKDYGGGYQQWNFPTLGAGVVDFAGVFRLLDDAGFAGPCTMELEGVRDVTYDLDSRLAYVADSVAHLRSLGV